MADPITILLIDDHRVVRVGLRAIIDAEPDIAVLFTDVVMPDMNGKRLAEAALARERDEQLHRFGADQVFGIIEQHVARPQREILEALRVGREQLSQVRAREIVAMRFKREPRAG